METALPTHRLLQGLRDTQPNVREGAGPRRELSVLHGVGVTTLGAALTLCVIPAGGPGLGQGDGESGRRALLIPRATTQTPRVPPVLMAAPRAVTGLSFLLGS